MIQFRNNRNKNIKLHSLQTHAVPVLQNTRSRMEKNKNDIGDLHTNNFT